MTLCYRDMTFCEFWRDCAEGDACDRALTAQVQADADEWWGGDDYPIMVFAERPECFKEKPGTV